MDSLNSEKYDYLYQNLPVMIHSIDRDGVIRRVNKAWLETMGYEAEEVLGKASTEFLTEDSRKYAREVVLPAFFRDGQCSNIHYKFVKKSGAEIEVLLSASAEFDSDGNITRSLAVLKDITDLREEIRRITKMESSAGLSSEEQHSSLPFAEMLPREKLYKLRMERSYSQEEMAEALNVSYRTYQRIEYGESSVTVDFIMKACEVFKISPHYFF